MAFVELEIKGSVGVLTINRPEALNALKVEHGICFRDFKPGTNHPCRFGFDNL